VSESYAACCPQYRHKTCCQAGAEFQTWLNSTPPAFNTTKQTAPPFPTKSASNFTEPSRQALCMAVIDAIVSQARSAPPSSAPEDRRPQHPPVCGVLQRIRHHRLHQHPCA
jgi:hypothetical protein